VIPGLVGQSITAFKNTSLVVIIGLLDLLGITQSILANPNFLGLERELYLFLMVLYFAFSSLLSYGGRRLEQSMGMGCRCPTSRGRGPGGRRLGFRVRCRLYPPSAPALEARHAPARLAISP